MTLQGGTRLGLYEILAPIGAGGMGEVYRARDQKLDRDVAIKVLPLSVAADSEALARFELEAKAVAALSHPNILSIFDFGMQDGVAYAVMELLEGESLRKKLEAGPLTPKQAVDYAIQIARGLSAAHEKGIVHRDLKPENLFVDKEGHLKILDFGLAKRIEKVSPDDETSGPEGSGRMQAQAGSARTEPGAVLGTLGYMSPEQLRGIPVDHRCDIFSLGAILYEMLSGRSAFKQATASDTIVAILREEPAELSTSGRSIAPMVNQVVQRCLEKNREDRFQSARDIAVLLSEPSSATATALAAHGAPGQRRKVPIAVAAAAAVALIALAGIGLFLRRQSHGGPGASGDVKRVAVLPFENQGGPEDDYFADGISDEIRGKLISLAGVQVIARGSSKPYGKTTKTPRQIAEELNVGYLLTATVRWETKDGIRRVLVTPELIEVSGSEAPTSKWQQPFDAAMTDVFQVQSDIASRVAEALGVALGAAEAQRLSEKPTQNLDAYEAFLRGEQASNSLGAIDPPSVRKALGFYEQAVALDPGFLLAWQRVSEAASIRFADAIPTPEVAHRAKEAAEKAVALAPDRPEGYLALGTYERLVRSDAQRALEVFAKAQSIAPGNADVFRGIGLAEQSLGRLESAVDDLRQAERLDPRSVVLSTSIGSALLRLRRYTEARETLDRGLGLAPANLRLIENKAMTYLCEGDLTGARKVIEAAPSAVEPTALVAYLANYNDLVWVLDESQREVLLRLEPKAFDDDRATWALALVQAYVLRGDAAKVRAYAEIASKAFAEQVRVAPGEVGRQMSLALSLAYRGRKDEAIRVGERGYASESVAKDARVGAYNLHQLVRIYVLTGETEKALDNLDLLLKVPYYLGPGWLRIDPNFDALRKNPRFQKLVDGGA